MVTKTRNIQQTIQIKTSSRNGLYDITREMEAIISESGVQSGLVNVYAQGESALTEVKRN